MPRDTFLNLSADKRARFVDVALDEFASLPYDQASITAIVAKLGIAKGSIYQYFDDKFDLYAWLLAEAGRRKLAITGATLPGPFFARLRAMYRSGLVFWQTEPRWARIGMRLLERSTEPRLEALRRASMDRARAWMRSELASAVASRELSGDVDPELVAPLVLAVLQEGVLNAILARAGTDLGDADVAARLAALTPDDLERITDAAVTLLERGLGVTGADR